jgi:sterol desaturase/sphingolipid hydroxylase (fatty acid hydroxylase superfamily)
MLVGAAFHLVAGIIFFTPLERLFAMHPGRGWWQRRFIADLLLWFSHPLSYACGVTVAAGLARMLPRSAVATWVAAMPFWSQIFVAIVAADLAGYLLHRAYHRVPLLWAFHAVHHSSREVDWLASSRLHPVSQTVNAALVAAPLLVCGLPLRAVVIANAVIGLWAVSAHANVRLGFGPLGRLFVSPAFHRSHHASAVDKNFGGMFALYDLVFGTWERPAGLPCRAAEPVREDLVSLLLYPFASMWIQRAVGSRSAASLSIIESASSSSSRVGWTGASASAAFSSRSRPPSSS